MTLALNIFPFWWGLPATDAWAFDEILPSAVLSGLDRHFSDGWGGAYPPFHYYVLSALYSPVLLAKHLGWLDLGQGSLEQLLFYLGRSLSVLLATATVFVVYRCARRLGSETTALLTALITALIPSFVYYAKTMNLEAPYLFWVACSWLCLLRVFDEHRLRDYLWLAVTATFALCTKDQAGALYLLLPVWLTIDLRRHSGRRWLRVIFDRRLVLSGLLATALFVLVQNLAFNLDGFRSHLEFITLKSPSLFDLYPPTLQGYLALTLQSIRHLGFSLGWPLLLAAWIGLGGCLRDARSEGRLLALAAMGVSYYLFFILPIRHNYVRFLLPLALVASFFAARGLVLVFGSPWWRRSRGARWAGGLLIVLILGHQATRALSVDLLMHFDARYQVEAWLHQQVDDGNGTVIGIGRQNLLPRDLRIVPWRRAQRRGGKFVSEPPIERVIFNRTDGWSEENRRIRTAFESGALGFELEMTFVGRAPWNTLGADGMLTNLSALNPQIDVYRRMQVSDAVEEAAR